jgi:uncharacterized protein (DUF433 family)
VPAPPRTLLNEARKTIRNRRTRYVSADSVSETRLSVVKRPPPSSLPTINLRDHPLIRIDPQVCAGEPVIRGTRVHIKIILGCLAEGMSPAEVIEHFPHLNEAQIEAAAGFAAAVLDAVYAPEIDW